MPTTVTEDTLYPEPLTALPESGGPEARTFAISTLLTMAALPMQPGVWLLSLAPWLWGMVSWHLPTRSRYHPRYVRTKKIRKAGEIRVSIMRQLAGGKAASHPTLV